MPVSSYYGDSELRTFLEFGEESADGFTRTIQRRLTGQEAYDQWHLALYMKDWLNCRTVLADPDLTVSRIPRPDKNLLTYFLMTTGIGLDSVCELGSTIFELIDGLKVAEKWYAKVSGKPGNVSLESIEWLGIELSELFTQAATILHPDYRLRHFSRVEELTQRPSLLLDRSVSNYCFASAREFASFMNRCELGYINSFFSLEDDFASTRYGKQLMYFSLSDFIAASDKPVFHLYGFKAPRPIGDQDLARGRPVIEGFWGVGPRKVFEELIETAKSFPESAAFVADKNIRLTEAEAMLSKSPST